ncbi:F-box only protein 21 [Striga asiatica]|uniref:F-box only protein 21 n=1 Tax=Striga asiatica TaxID=4170 RepID=A0A5A7P961_STRAF|nr:F-box only protein 21 [Striga asiatica]
MTNASISISVWNTAVEKMICNFALREWEFTSKVAFDIQRLIASLNLQVLRNILEYNPTTLSLFFILPPTLQWHEQSRYEGDSYADKDHILLNPGVFEEDKGVLLLRLRNRKRIREDKEDEKIKEFWQRTIQRGTCYLGSTSSLLSILLGPFKDEHLYPLKDLNLPEIGRHRERDREIVCFDGLSPAPLPDFRLRQCVCTREREILPLGE